MCACAVIQSCLTLCDFWMVAYQAPLYMGFFSQEYWSGLSFPPSVDLPDPEIEPASPVFPVLQADSLPDEPSEKTKKIYFSLCQTVSCLCFPLRVSWYMVLHLAL